MPPISPNGDLNSVVNQINQNIAQQNTDSITKITKDDTGTRRVLSGKGDNGFYGFKVSKANKDVFTAADSDLIFNSDQNVFKIVEKITYPFSFTSGTTQSSTRYTIPHGMGYVPLFLCTVDITTNQISTGDVGIFTMPYIKAGVGGGTTNAFIIIEYCQLDGIDTNNIYVEVGAIGNTQTLAGTITAFVLQETAT